MNANQKDLDLDPCGFTTLGAMARRLEEWGSEGLLARVDGAPTIVTLCGPFPSPCCPGLTGSTAWVLPGAAVECTCSDADRSCEVGLLRKRPGAPFPAMITVGRSAPCDLRLPYPTVSKIHAFFLRDGSRWLLGDEGSMNRTTHNGSPILAGLKVPLQDRDRIDFGGAARFRFLLPETLVDLLRSLPVSAP